MRLNALIALALGAALFVFMGLAHKSGNRDLARYSVELWVTYCGILACIGIARHFGLRMAATTACAGFARLAHGVHDGARSVRLYRRGVPVRVEVEPPTAVAVSVGDSNASVRYGVARLTFNLPRRLPRLYVYPIPCALQRLANCLVPGGLPHVRTGNRQFDHRFTVATDDAAFAHRLLTPDARQQFALLGKDVGLHTEGSRLIVELQLSDVPPAPGLKTFYDQGAVLFDLLLPALGANEQEDGSGVGCGAWPAGPQDRAQG